MSLIETAPQKHKSYNEKHTNENAEQKGHNSKNTLFHKELYEGYKKADKERLQYDLSEAEIENWTNEILAGPDSQIDPEFDPSVFLNGEEIFDTDEINPYEATAEELIDRIALLKAKRQQLVGKVNPMHANQLAAIDKEIASITDYGVSIVLGEVDTTSQEEGLTVEQFDIKSKHAIRKEMAHRVMLGYDPDDDNGDPDFGPVRVKNKL